MSHLFSYSSVGCNDIETYKDDTRQKLRQWITPLQERDMEYLILYISTQAKKSNALSLLTRSVLHSLQNDFKSKIDRICVVKTEQDTATEEEQWRDVWTKMSDSIARHFTRTVDSFYREIRKLDSERTLPGWNFCKFFVIKVYVYRKV
jgi:exonuclease VII large subunit